MAGISIKTTNNFATETRQFQAAKSRAGRATVAECVAMAQTLVRVDTGQLKNDIRFGEEDENTFWFGASSTGHALVNEIGSRRMSAQPYLRPSADRMFPTYGDRLKRELG